MRAALLLLLSLSLGVSEAEEEHYYPAASCISSCDAGHKCLSDECVERWDDCTQGYDLVDGLEFVQISKSILFDEQDCYDNGCSFGGCDKPGYAEKSKEACSNILDAFCVFCYRERCCRLREWVRCCPRLDCIKELAGCPDVPQQEGTPSESSLFYTKLASGGAAVMPFYLQEQVGFGEDCAAQRVLGACTCADGAKLPGGCLASDSATWAAWNGTHALQQPLPPHLSLTCTSLPAPEPPPVSAPPPDSSPPSSDAAGGVTNSTGSDADAQSSTASSDPSSMDAGVEPGMSPGASGAGGGGSSGQSSAQAGMDEGGGVVDGSGAARDGEGRGHGGVGRSGAWVAGVVAAVSVVSTLAVLAVIAGTVACLRMRHQSHVLAPDAYRAMLTGTSYTPPMRVRAPVVGVVKNALQRLFGQKQSISPDSSRLESGSLQEPAVPPDDELFTLDDLEHCAQERQKGQGPRSSRHAKWHDKRSKYDAGKGDVEMQEQAGLLSKEQQDTPDITTHTIPLDDGQAATENGQAGSKPLTPQPTGEGRKRPSSGNPGD